MEMASYVQMPVRRHFICNICLSPCLSRFRPNVGLLQSSSPLSRPKFSTFTKIYEQQTHSRTPSGQQNNFDSQAHPIGDFYADLLTTSIPKAQEARTDLPSFVDSGGDATKEERAAKLFGNIKGSGYERNVSETPDATWQTINGVPVPPRPGEPDNCCMSGCVQ